MSAPTHFRFAIAGTGFGGLGMAIQLKKTGRSDFVLLERASDVGGVWRDNRYPGCACDVQSNLYSFSFAPNPEWSREYSPAAEIHRYLKDCAQRFDLLPHIRFGHEVRQARWDERAQLWRIDTSQGVLTADIFISGAGALSDPAMPKLKGLQTFTGKVMHSARWDASHPLEGAEVAVIGTGASAIQFVPAIQPKVATLRIFQRTPPWVIARNDRPVPVWKKSLFRRLPLLMQFARGFTYGVRELFVLGFRNPAVMNLLRRYALRHLTRAVADPALRARLMPSYVIGCKRILISDDYLPSLTKPNVEVVTEAIAEIRAHSVITADGREHPCDTLIFGTGFQVTDLPIAKQVHGRDGRTLAEVWNGSPKAHLGTTVTGFPNLFILQGPNTGLGHSSVLTMIEAQFTHILKAVDFLDATGNATLEPTAEAQAAFVSEVERKMRGTVWTAGGCASWYLDETGRNSSIWPGFTFMFRRRLARFVASDFVTTHRRPVPPDDSGERAEPLPVPTTSTLTSGARS